MHSTTAAYRRQSGSGEREENFPILKKPEQRISLKLRRSVWQKNYLLEPEESG